MIPLQSWPPNLVFTLTMLYGILLIALIGGIAYQRITRKSKSEWRERTQTWWWLVTIALIIFALGEVAFTILLSLVTLLAFREYLSLLPAKFQPKSKWPFLIIIFFQFYLSYTCPPQVFLTFIPILVFMGILTTAILRQKILHYWEKTAFWQWGLLLIPFNLSHLVALYPLNQGVPFKGQMAMVIVLVVTEGNDIAQFIFGKCFGKKNHFARN